MIEIREITPPTQKARICNDILRALPDWFGIESAIVDYTDQVPALPLFAALDGGQPVGFVALKPHNPDTAEVFVMGIAQTHHRRGIGGQLMTHAVRYCRGNSFRFLTVKTLDASAHSVAYDRTRAFYRAMGFYSLEAFPTLWDKHNPCLLMAKPLCCAD